MNIVIGSDHGGFQLKGKISDYLRKQGHTVEDMGVDGEESVDYPDVAERTCSAFKGGNFDFGVLLCGTGIGVSIAANKIPGIRCAQVWDLFTAEMAKAHNRANFIALGGRVKYPESPEKMIETYMQARFQGDRHTRRIEKIAALETGSA